jgi:ABC-2 type transport system ATP-binding protein
VLEFAIETCGLSHRFTPNEAVLQDIQLQVPVGSLYGFLGPNGAGKTTTLRLVLGLLRCQEGSIKVLGEPLESRRVALLRRIGSSIESPSLYAHLSAVENLTVWLKVFDCPARRVGEVLNQVGLSGTGGKVAGQFSLGMKQRLALAVALLHQPELLILDEPTNGLDPHGIHEMRDLLIRLNRDHGTTILVSSHLLSEVERLVTHVGIISRGTLRFQGPLAILADRNQADQQLILHTSDNPRALESLLASGWSARHEQGKILVQGVSAVQAGDLNHQLVMAGLTVLELTPVGRDLEHQFFDLIGN